MPFDPFAPFIAHITALAQQAALQGIATAMPGVGKRPWQIPPTYPVGVDVQLPAGFIFACNRDILNASCVAEYEAGATPNGGRLGVVGAYKIAIDYQAAFERALHARYASAVRCRIWASARRAGHADLTYGIFGCLLRGIADMVSAAQAIPNEQPPGSPP